VLAGRLSSINLMTQEEYMKLFEKYQEGKLTEDEKNSLLSYQDDFELSNDPWDVQAMGVKKEVQDEIYYHISQQIQ
jgi:hypothetical protein